MRPLYENPSEEHFKKHIASITFEYRPGKVHEDVCGPKWNDIKRFKVLAWCYQHMDLSSISYKITYAKLLKEYYGSDEYQRSLEAIRWIENEVDKR